MTNSSIYKRHRFPAEVIQYAVWLYFRFNLSHRDIEDLLAQRGIIISRESIRLWCDKFGSKYSARLRKTHQGYGDTFFIDEVFVKIDGKQHYLWRALNQDGEIVDVFLQKWRNAKAAKRFFVRLLRKHKGGPRKIVTDKLHSYDIAHRGYESGHTHWFIPTRISDRCFSRPSSYPASYYSTGNIRAKRSLPKT
jgi:putative transposase